MGKVPVSEYLAHALKVKPEEQALRNELRSWFPAAIIDCHAHCNLEEHVKFVADRAYGHMLSTFTHFGLKESVKLRDLFFPESTVRSLRFPKTFRGIDHRAANDYLLKESPEEDRIAVFGLPEDPDYTARIMRHPRASALKMYWSYVDPPAKKIYEYFTPEILEEAQALDLPIILHLPRSIAYTCDDLMLLLSDFPRLRVVLAHLGLSKLVVPGLEEGYRRAAKSDNVWLDTALCPTPEVVSLAFQCFGTERIMFGSDEPLNLIRSVAYTHPGKGERIVADYPYHWVDPAEHAEYGHLAENAVHAQWQCMIAIKEALEKLPLVERDQVKNAVFYKTAKEVFQF
jgi:hypothetical protein